MAGFLKNFGKSLGKFFKNGDLVGGLVGLGTTFLSGAISGGWRGIGKAFSNVAKGATGSGLTDSDKEAASLSLRNQQQLNEEEYQRKLDFYERFESPEAQVRQYKEAGLNPMLLGGSGAGAAASGGIGSAGSAPADNSSSTPDVASLLSTIVGMQQRRQQLGIERDAVAVQRQQAETAQYNAETERMYKQSLTAGQNTTNEWLSRLYGSQVAQGESAAEVNKAKVAQLEDLLRSQAVRRDFERKQIEVLDAHKAVEQYNAAILEAQSKYSDRYFKALAQIQTAQAIISSGEAGIFTKTLSHRLEAAKAELNRTIIEAGMQADLFSGDAFKAQVEGRMTDAQKKQVWISAGSSMLGSVIGAGAALGGAYILGSSRVAAAGVSRMSAFPGLSYPGTASSYFHGNPTYLPGSPALLQ